MSPIGKPKIALVTGSARRLGAAIAERLHQAGLNVIIHYNTSEQEAINLVNTFNRQRVNSALAIQADLTRINTIAPLVKEAVQAWGGLDLLINNASRFYATPVGSTTEAQWDDLMASNLKAPFFLCQEAAPYLSQHQGAIVNITDIHSERPLKNYTSYCIAKAGLTLLTKALARELAPNVRVNAVAPGSILWPEHDNELSPAQQQEILSRITLQRQGSLEDIAEAVLFLGLKGNYTTGEILHVDGGRLLK